MKPAMLVKFTY